MIDDNGRFIFGEDPCDQDTLAEFLSVAERQVQAPMRLTDIHIDGGKSPWVIINDTLYPTNAGVVSKRLIDSCLECLSAEARHTFARTHDAGGRLKLDNGGIVRLQLYMCDENVTAAVRLQPPKPWKFEEMGLPLHLLKLLEKSQGAVIFSGAVGSRKTSVMHSMLDHVNHTSQKRRKHIYMIDDPPEFAHDPINALFHSREVGVTTPDFESAIYGSLRAKPDFLTIGEMRTAATIKAAILAASLGRNVLTSIHSETATQTISRLLQSFPTEMRDEMRAALADVLNAICALKVVPSTNGTNILAYEIMIMNPAYVNMLHDPVQLRGALDEPQHEGSNSFEACLSELFRTNQITRETAIEHAPDPTRLTIDRAA